MRQGITSKPHSWCGVPGCPCGGKPSKPHDASKPTSEVRCATCGELAGNTGSMAGIVHRWGPTDHEFIPTTQHTPGQYCVGGKQNMKGFTVSFETFTTESAQDGDAAERGMLLENATLREAIDELNELPALDSIEPDCWPIDRARPPRAFYATQGSDRYLYASGDDDEGESRALHIPDNVTASSRLRIARLLGLKTRERSGEVEAMTAKNATGGE